MVTITIITLLLDISYYTMFSHTTSPSELQLLLHVANDLEVEYRFQS